MAAVVNFDRVVEWQTRRGQSAASLAGSSPASVISLNVKSSWFRDQLNRVKKTVRLYILRGSVELTELGVA